MKIKVNGVELYYERYGDGEPIIFSHGWLEDCAVWKPHVEGLAKNNCVILYDLRGHGKSDKPTGEYYSVQTLADDLKYLMQALKLDKAILVGFSLGGMLSLVYTLQNPTKVSRLVLVGTTAKMPRMAKVTGILMPFIGYQTLIRKILIKIRFYKPSRDIVESFISKAMQVPKQVAYHTYIEFTNKYDIRSRVSEIKIPTLVIVGNNDKGIPIKSSQFLNREIEGSELKIILGSGHEVMVEKPDNFYQILKEFLGR